MANNAKTNIEHHYSCLDETPLVVHWIYEIIVTYLLLDDLIMKLLVRNLSRSTTEHELRVLFSEHGKVTECNLVLDQATGKSKGFGFVEMPNEAQAKTAIEKLHETRIAKNRIRVKVAQ